MDGLNLGARLDRLPWSKFHTLVAITLGIGWMLDAFQVTIIGGVMGFITKQFHVTAIQGSLAVSTWLVGIMIGAVLFGILTDYYGRKSMFILTLLVYAAFSVLTIFAWNYDSFLSLRFLTAIGVGGEYSAVNSAIQEFIPSSTRGRVGAAVDNMWSVGAVVASLVTIFFVGILPPTIGWRVGFGFGALVALFVLFARRGIPESPRWLFSKKRSQEADAVVNQIEERVKSERGLAHLPAYEAANVKEPEKVLSFWKQMGELFAKYPGRLLLGMGLDFSEASGYYGLFTFAAVVVFPAIHLTPVESVWYYLWGGVGAVIGGIVPYLLMDKIGRRITVTSGYVMAVFAMLVVAAAASTGSQTAVLWAFMLGEACATWAWVSAYPTFSEAFPTHLRATGVGVSVAVGRLGAAFAPLWLASIAVHSGEGTALTYLAGFYGIGVVVMIIWSIFGVEAANKSLEEVAPPPVM